MARIKIPPALGLAVQCGIGLLALSWVISRSDLTLAELTQRLSQVGLFPLGLGIICFGMAIGLGALRYRFFLPTAISTPYLSGLVLVQIALLTFMPWRTGEVGYPLLLRRDFQIPISSSTAVILIIRLTDLLIILTVALIGSPKILIPEDWSGPWIIGLIIFLALGAILAIQWRMGPRLWQILQPVIEPLRSPLQLTVFLVLSGALFGLGTLQAMFILQATGLSVALGDIALLNALTLMAALLPIHPPGGWGTVDSLQVILLGNLGYDPTVSTASILAAHAVYTVLILFGGMMGWFLCRKIRSAAETA